MPRVVLVGPPGSGETTTGQALAELLGVGFHDTDAAVEEARGFGVVTPKDLAGRTDFRQTVTVTIDGEHARDFDDAISIETLDPSLKLGRNGCVVDTATGRVTVTLKATADTIIAGRFGPTADYTEVVVRESSGPSNV